MQPIARAQHRRFVGAGMRVRRGALVVTAVALLYVLLWSSGFIAAKVCVRYCPPMTLLSVREARHPLGQRVDA
jgi:hypothetical protein